MRFIEQVVNELRILNIHYAPLKVHNVISTPLAALIELSKWQVHAVHHLNRKQSKFKHTQLVVSSLKSIEVPFYTTRGVEIIHCIHKKHFESKTCLCLPMMGQNGSLPKLISMDEWN